MRNRRSGSGKCLAVLLAFAMAAASVPESNGYCAEAAYEVYEDAETEMQTQRLSELSRSDLDEAAENDETPEESAENGADGVTEETTEKESDETAEESSGNGSDETAEESSGNGSDQTMPETQESESREEMTELPEKDTENNVSDSQEGKAEETETDKTETDKTETEKAETEETMTESGNEDISGEDSGEDTFWESEGMTEIWTGSMTEQIPELELEEMTEVDLEKMTEILESELLEEEYAVSLLADSYTPPGTSAAAASAGYTVVNVGDRRYSGKYNEVQRNSSSVVTAWDNSGGHVTKGTKTNSAGKTYTYFVPKDDKAAGKFGFRVTNVAYNRTEKCAVDLIITVVGYNNYTYSKYGNKIEDVYPCIGYTPKGGLAYHSALPAIRLKCELVKMGTNTAVSGDYRFTLTDIDAGQIYGLTLFNGQIDAKYCTASTAVNAGKRTLSDGKEYYMIYAPDESSAETDKNHAVSFEVSSMSTFGIFIDSARRVGTVGGYSANLIREVYQDVKDGVWDSSGGSLLGWDSWAFGPPEVSPVYKYVSNDGNSWSKENTLSSVNSEFWYMLEVYAPEMSGYSYKRFFLQDTLPAGVDYVGDFSALQVETGEDASGYFTLSEGEELTATYNGTSGFNGYTYQLKFKVKMDPTETTPVLSGSKAIYTVENQGILYYQTYSDASVLTTNSDTVVTTAQKERPVPEKPEKKINVNGTMYESREYSKRGEEITFTVRQKVPAYESFWHMDSFIFEDTLEPCFELVRVELGTDQSPGSTVFQGTENGVLRNGWGFDRKGYTITAKLYSSGMTDQHFNGSTVYRMDIIVKIKEGYDLSSYYEQVSGGNEMAVIPNTAGSKFVWGSESYDQVTNQVKVVLDENRAEFAKLDKVTGKAVSGAKLQLSGSDGTVIDTWISGTAPHQIFGIEAGTYTLTELEAPDGYKKAAPVTVVIKRTSQLQSFSMYDVKYVTITVKKSILVSEIVWAHGHPTFTFCVEGTDLDGETCTYYETVEFTPENTDMAAGQAVSLQAVFRVPAGEYTAYEANVIRYKLEKIDGVVNGTISGPAVLFDLRKNKDGSAVFHNRKTTDTGITDTDFVRNVVIK